MKRLLCVSVLVAVAGAASADDCAFQARRDLDLPAAGVKQLKLQTQAGDLRIVGVAGLSTVEFRGKACASTAEQLEKLTLQHTAGAGRLDVNTTAPGDNDFKLFGSNYAYIDLEVRMPQALALELADSSGDTEIADAGPVDLTDSSGDIKIRDPRGDVRVRDTSGDIDIDEAQGAITIASDSSGDIEIDGARRDVLVEDDSSGDIEIDKVGGNVRVGRDSSGDIKIRHVAGSAEVGSDSSGMIYADDIKGDFRVASKSGGRSSIEYADIGGKVSVPDYD
ncbi:MAG TPA: DUF4097 family beta strand repeat-containing protein [Tahibacter sp.]|uniref:DUF4097 family beta strand repeat-containing protein n=1 Tax=Tahibacter sp. TaxID=2056211 RepID=UPI002CA52C60|nr:DUF4097 family beta strand repeat-containing protein [Tahibacter sp.]HSX58757.1 DUF4097 family beta strand repeat-containing protein [Tahibacter sp.]